MAWIMQQNKIVSVYLNVCALMIKVMETYDILW